jgi:hypothetical protein
MARTFLTSLLRAGSVAMTAGIGIAMSSDAHSAAQRFQVHARLSPAPAAQSSASGLGLHAQLQASARRRSLSGGGYALVASLAAPMVCTDDTIFIDGFDLP